MVAIVICCVLLLPACNLPRILPDRAAPSIYAGLDMCAVVPVHQLRNEHPALEVAGTYNVPSSCRISLGTTGGTIHIHEVPNPAPKIVSERGQDNVTEERFDNGRLLHHVNETGECRSYVIADSGVWLELLGDDPTSGAGPTSLSEVCRLIRQVATATLQTLSTAAPMIDWPADSLYRKDICQAVETSGLLSALGVPGDLIASPLHLHCRRSGLGVTDPIRSLHVEASVGHKLDQATVGSTVITIADHPAELREKRSDRGPNVPRHVSCEIAIEFGPSDHYSRMTGRAEREQLRVSVGAAEPYDCQKAVEAAAPLVSALV